MEQRGNRFDSIRAHALDAAVLLGAGPDTCDRVADALVRLCGEMIESAGKSLAIGGESDMNDCRTYGEESRGDSINAYTRYLAGERLQDGARDTVKEVLDADLERYARDGLKPVWVPPTGAARTREQAATGTQPSLSQRAEQAAATFGPYTGPKGANGEAPQFQLNLGQRVRQAVHATGSVQPVNPHTWVPALDGDNRPLNYDHCGVCGQRKCEWLSGDAVPACDWDPDCPVHGDVIAQGCGSSAVATGLPRPEGARLFDADTQPLRVIPLHVAERLKQPLQRGDVVAPDAARRSIHGDTPARIVAEGRCAEYGCPCGAMPGNRS